jgi:diguanylate cyclase (GGDEF)-like protein
VIEAPSRGPETPPAGPHDPGFLPSGVALGVAAVTIVVVATLQLAVGPSPRLLGLMAIPPFVSVLQRSRTGSALTGAVSLSTTVIVGAVQGIDAQRFLTAAVVAAAALLAIWVSALRLRLDEALHTAVELATSDPLTGRLNRRALFARLEALTALRPGVRPTLVLLMIDVDKLKPVNDQWGHAVGDRMLVETATRIRRELRDGDLLGRYGGDEFLAVAVGLSDLEAADVGHRLCGVVGGSSLDVEGASLLMSVSIGITAVRDDESSPEGPIERADRALYVAKAKGRGQVALA